jgi:hypothetical protein
VNAVADSRKQVPRLAVGLPNPNRDLSDWAQPSSDKSDGRPGLSIAIPYHDLQFQEILPSRLLLITHMASRRLALNLSQGLRGRAGLNAVAPLRRGFATPVVKNGVKTETTTLTNGLTVRLECTGEVKYLLTSDRSLPSIRHGRRHRQLASGSMLDHGQRRTTPTAQLISWSISHSRSGTMLLDQRDVRR